MGAAHTPVDYRIKMGYYDSMGIWSKPEYNTPQELETAIESYFKLITESGETFVDRFGMPKVLGKKHATPPGLALHLGYSSFQQMMSEFPPEKPLHRQLIRRAISMIEDGLLQRLQDSDVKTAGPVFILKNLGYKDEQRITIDDAPRNEVSTKGFKLAISLVKSPNSALPSPDELRIALETSKEQDSTPEPVTLKAPQNEDMEAVWEDVGD